MNLLFLCSRNQWHSRTAETIFKNNGYHQIRSAGTESSTRIRVNQNLVDWADVIFVMEQKLKDRLYAKFTVPQAKADIVILDIPDNYGYMDEELIGILEGSVADWMTIE